MGCIDLLAYTRKQGNLKGIELYGHIEKEIEPPSNLEQGLGKGGHFYVFKVVCVNLSAKAVDLESIGLQAPDNIYYVNGSVCVYSEEKPSGWLKCVGDLRCGTKDRSNYLCMFRFRKVGGKWALGSNTFEGVREANFWSQDNACKEVFLQAVKTGVLCLPPYVMDLPLFVGELPYGYRIVQKEEEEILPFNVESKKFRKPTELHTRESIAPYSPLVEQLDDKLAKAKIRLDEHLKSLFSKYNLGGYVVEKAALCSILQNLIKYAKKKQGYYTGEAVIGKYLDTFGKDVRQHYCGSTVRKVLKGMLGDIYDFIEKGTPFNLTGVAKEVAYEAFGDIPTFFAGVLGVLTGISPTILTEMAKVCERYQLSFAKIVLHDPYLLQNLGGLTYNDMTKLAMALGVYNQLHNTENKNIALVDAFITDTSKGSTYFSEADIYSLGDYLTSTQYNASLSNGSPLNSKITQGLEAFLGKPVSHINLSHFRACGAGYKAYLTKDSKAKAIQAYVRAGVGVEHLGYIMSTSTLNKEIYVYKALYEMGSTPTKLTKEAIEQEVATIEENLPFTLEERQRQAPLLLQYCCGCLTGGAGSGKTTTVDVMVQVLSELDSETNLRFATPTGKSAKRLQEVIGYPVSTMHSLFSTGGDVGSILSAAAEPKTKKIKGKTFFLDESAMVTLDLLYACLRKAEDCKFYFIGDIRQLPPIGKGLPFKNMLGFLPSVALNVSKRAKEGSNITLNANLITDNSDDTNWENLKSGDDFYIGVCSDEDLVAATYNLCKHYLGKSTIEESNQLAQKLGWETLPDVKVTPDDIMVVSPFVKSSCAWGTTQLNRVLQPLFNANNNPDNTYTNTLTKGKFFKGDRVVHSESNMYYKQWYEQTATGFRTIDGCGIANGEVGKIVGLYSSDAIELEIDRRLHTTSYPENMQDDSKWSNHFLAVQYYDYIDKDNFIILYRVEEDYNTNGDSHPLKGEELSLLNLFYAGSVHKMQGSQEKLIVSVLGDTKASNFITRNLMYTVYTRGSEMVFALGSVGANQGSVLSQARKNIAEEHINTLGELLNNA